MRNIIVLLAVVVSLLFIDGCNARSSKYYDMVTDVTSGINYYQILGLTPDAEASDIRRAFRNLALTTHPDKPGGSEALYLAVVRASEALSDTESRKEYDDLLANGVPWQENYYGKYAHKYGAPDVDIRYILLGLISVTSVLQYAYKNHKHHNYMRMAKKNVLYQNKVKKIQSTKAKKSRFEEEEEDEDLPQIQLVGADKPKWTDVLAVQLVLSPYTLPKKIYALGRRIYREYYLGIKRTPEEIAQDMLSRLGMTQEEFDEEQKKALARQEKFKSSAKYKKMMRFMKNR